MSSNGVGEAPQVDDADVRAEGVADGSEWIRRHDDLVGVFQIDFRPFTTTPSGLVRDIEAGTVDPRLIGPSLPKAVVLIGHQRSSVAISEQSAAGLIWRAERKE